MIYVDAVFAVISCRSCGTANVERMLRINALLLGYRIYRAYRMVSAPARYATK